MYLLGKTGMGKSTMMQNMCLQDIYNGKGVCFIDPHGDSVEYILDRLPMNRQEDVIYFNPADVENPIGLNVLQVDKDEQNYLICSGLLSIFKRIWSGMWSSRMEYILNNTILALLEQPDSTLLSVVKMLSDEQFTSYVVSKTNNPLVKNFWIREYANFHDKYRQEAVAPILNKIGQFFSTEVIRNILGQVKSSFSIRDIIDNKKILLVNLSKGRLGEDNSNLLGSLLVTKLQLAAMSRVDLRQEDRSNFCLYVDEFQNFTTDSFASILSEARKYGLNLTLAHQYIDQLIETGNESVKNAIFGNIGSMAIFQLGAPDATKLAVEFDPIYSKQDLINLDKAEIIAKLSILGRTSLPFLARTMPPIFDSFGGKKDYFTKLSQQKYGRSRKVVNDQIQKFLLGDLNSQTYKSKRKK
jgi:type IV secretory pathway TraG/TraD family ATPase VirD4